MSIVGDYSLLCRLPNDPYDVMGCWIYDDYFISGTMEWDYESFNASIWLCSPPSVKNKNSNLEDSSIVSNLCNSNTKELSMDCDSTSSLPADETNNDETVRSETTDPEQQSNIHTESSNDSIVVSWYKKQLLKFRNLQVRYDHVSFNSLTQNIILKVTCAAFAKHTLHIEYYREPSM